MIKISKSVYNKNEKREELKILKKTRIFLGLLLIMVMVAFSGCGNNNPTTIDPDTPNNTTNSGILNDNTNRNNDNGILNDNDKNKNDGMLYNDNNNVNNYTTDSSIKNKANTPNNQ